MERTTSPNPPPLSHSPTISRPHLSSSTPRWRRLLYHLLDRRSCAGGFAPPTSPSFQLGWVQQTSHMSSLRSDAPFAPSSLRCSHGNNTLYVTQSFCGGSLTQVRNL